MDASALRTGVEVGLAIAGVGLSVVAIVWLIGTIVRRKSGPYYMELAWIAWATGVILSFVDEFATPATRDHLAPVSQAGHYLWIAAALVIIGLHYGRRRIAR